MTDRHLRAVTDGDTLARYDGAAARTILRAAHVLRGRIATAMPGPWTSWPAAGNQAEVVTSATTGLTVGIAPPPIEDVGWTITFGTADLIALMGPDVAGHIAGWLEDVHRRLPSVTDDEQTHALAVARGLLREEI